MLPFIYILEMATSKVVSDIYYIYIVCVGDNVTATATNVITLDYFRANEQSEHAHNLKMYCVYMQ